MRISRAMAWMLVCLCTARLGAQSVLFDLQGLPISDEFSSEVFGISANGNAIVGRGTPAQRAWRLDDQFITIFLGDRQGGGDISTAYAASADGSVVVGQVNTFNGPEAFRWTEASGLMIGLGDLPGGLFESGALGVSHDGNVVVGYGLSPGGELSGAEAFRWTLTDPATGSGVMRGLGDLPGGDTTSAATGVSADGRIVVGASKSALSDDHSQLATEAFRWQLADPDTGAGTMAGLGDLPGGGFDSVATAVSADGTTVVGRGLSASGTEAFLWRHGLMTGLGDLPGGNFYSVANAVSADGSVIVGLSAVAIGDGGLDEFHPFIWDAVNGMRDLVGVFAQQGLTLPNLMMTSATGVSADGTTIAGIGKSTFRTPAGDRRTESWVGRLVVDRPQGDYNGNGTVEQADLDLVLLHWGRATPPIPTGWINDPPTGTIDQAELDEVLLNWGAGRLAAATVPEPAASILIISCVLLSMCVGRMISLDNKPHAKQRSTYGTSHNLPLLRGALTKWLARLRSHQERRCLVLVHGRRPRRALLPGQEPGDP